MKKILIIAPSSFPVFGAEAIVNIKLIKSLYEDGYKIDLISKKNKNQHYPSKDDVKDYCLELNNLNVIEVDNKINLITILQHIIAYFKFGCLFKGMHWALKALNSIDKNNLQSYDYVLTKSSPSFLVGFYLKKKYNIKWVSTWNDPFPAEYSPYPYGQGFYKKLPFFKRNIIKIMNYSDSYIFPTDRLAKYMSNYLVLKDKDVHIIPHLVDIPKDKTSKKSNILRIVHTGNLRKPRDPRPLLNAVKNLIELGNKDICLDLIGVFDNDIPKVIDELGINNYVCLKASMEYTESLNILLQYDLGIIIEADVKEGIYLPTKVGDYMFMNLPIFSISPSNGELNDLYNQGYVQYFTTNDVSQIVSVLLVIFNDFKTNKLKKSNLDINFLAKNIVQKYNNL